MSESAHGWGLLRVTAQVATHLCARSMQTKGRGWWEDWVDEHSLCRKRFLIRSFLKLSSVQAPGPGPHLIR